MTRRPPRSPLFPYPTLSRSVSRLAANHQKILRAVKPAASGAWRAEKLNPVERRLLRKAHQVLRHVTDDMEVRWHYNTDIAMCMELVNELAEAEPEFERGKLRAEAFRAALELMVISLSPFAPHVADEIW